MKPLTCDEFSTNQPHSGNPVCDHWLIEPHLRGLGTIPAPSGTQERIWSQVSRESLPESIRGRDSSPSSSPAPSLIPAASLGVGE